MSGDIYPQKVSIIWLDSSGKDSPDSIVVQKQLRIIDEQFKLFDNVVACKEYLNKQPKDSYIILIVSGGLGHQLVPEIHNLLQVKHIYVYCVDVESHKKWAEKYTKTRGVFADFNALHQNLLPDHTCPNVDRSSSQIKSDTPMETGVSTTIPPPPEQSSTNPPSTDPQETVPSKTEEPATTTAETNTNTVAQSASEPTCDPCIYAQDTKYHISDSCYDYISRMKLNSTEIEDFISFCQDAFKGNESLYPFILEFQEKYSAEKAISCFFIHGFFPGYLENIFKGAYIDAMFPCRMFIHDIQKQLEKHKCTSAIQAFRCELISNEQLQQLITLNGKIIAIKYFFWTNLKREQALEYVPHDSSNNQYKRILFIVDADPQVKNTKPFAKLDSLMNTSDSNDVLFMIGSLFKITAIGDEKDNIITINLQLCAHDDGDKMKIQIDEIKQQYIDSNGNTDIVGMGEFLIAFGSSLGAKDISDSGERLIRAHHDKLSPDHSDHFHCCYALGRLDSSKGDYDSSLASYKKVLELKTKSLSGDDLSLAILHGDMASVYYDKNDLDQALQHFEQTLKIWKVLKGDDDINLVHYYTDMGNIYEKQQRWVDAFCCYSQVEKILVKTNTTNDYRFALSCNNLANLHLHLCRYHLALGYYQTSLTIKKETLPSIHPSIALTLRNIGMVYKSLNDLQQARTMFEQALNIYRGIQSSDNANITETEQLIESLSSAST